MVEPAAPRRLSTRARVVLGLVALVLAGVLLAVVTFGPARDREVSRLGDDVFDIGDTTRIATEIADRGPILYPDPVDGSEPVWVQHLGADPSTNWYVFAHLSGPDCPTEWIADDEAFEDCDGVRFPADGEGLAQYPVEVDGSVVSVDLNFAEREAAS